jgi:hypothetical protein
MTHQEESEMASKGIVRQRTGKDDEKVAEAYWKP